MSTTSRRLETLSLLQAHPGISATRLAARLGVTERTARRDVAHLRELGYRIDAEAGPAGGYRLASGRTMPPLLLDADEVAAVALAQGPWRHRVRVRVHTSADLLRELVHPSVATVVDHGDECELHFGTDDLDRAARWLVHLNLDVDVIEPAVLTDRLRTLGRWLLDRY